MKYFKKILLIFFFPILVLSCGYEPIYKDIANLNFSIIVNNISGNEKINRLIKNKLKNYNYNQERFKKYNVNIVSKYLKTTISKDATGKATDYEISVKIKFEVSSTNYEKDFSYSESFITKKNNDKIEEKDNDQNIINNLVNTIARKFILNLSQIK